MAEVIPMEIPGTGPLKESINKLFAKVVKKATEGGKYDYIRKRLPILQGKTDEIIRQTIQESEHDTTSDDSPDIMKYVAEFVDKIEIKIDTKVKTHVTLIPDNHAVKRFDNTKIYCLAIKIFDNLMDQLLGIYEPLDFNPDYDYGPDHLRQNISSYNQNMKICNPLSMSQELGGTGEGGSKSRRRHRRHRKPVRKTRRGRTRKSKSKSKTHRRRRIHKNKKYTRKH